MLLVVYRPFPTSNHNLVVLTIKNSLSCISSVSYIKPQLKLVKDWITVSCISSVSYIKPQRLVLMIFILLSCISSVSYIKPQLVFYLFYTASVVYRPFPTSNHNFVYI